MSPQSASLFDFDFYEPLPIQVEVSDAPLTSDAGLLPLRQFDQRIGLTSQLAAALHDPRDPDLIEHTFPEMVRSRVFGILAGYEDQNDHDTLRTDPTFKLIANRSPDDADLASQPTLSRFENQIDIPSLFRLRDVFIDQFIASFAQPPITLTFDLDAVDDPTHGSQQLTLFHGFYDQYQYLPLVITCARTTRSRCSACVTGTWNLPRWVVVKAEAHAQGTNRRFVTTNRPGAQAYLEATYDEYVMRGESENRNKEFKCGMAMDRLSDHRFMANYFRLYLHAAALNLLVRLRREIADPPPAPAGDVPVAVLPEPARKQYQNARRRRDPLGEGQPATWRLLLIKVAASVVVSCRRIVVRLSGSWPNQQFFERVAQHVCRRPAVAHFWTG